MSATSHVRALAAAAVLATAAAPAAAQRVIDERMPAAADGHVRIHNIAGSVKITGWDRDSIVVTGTVHDTPGERFAVKHGETGVLIGIWDTTVEQAKPSAIEVRLPARSRVWIRTGSAGVFIGGVTGSIDAGSVGGDIEIHGTPADVFVESMTGGLVLDLTTGVVQAKTVTSSIRIHGTIANATATSVSGTVLIENANVRRGSFESVNGELRFVGTIRPGSALSFITHGGAVEFLLPSATAANFLVGTYEGSLVNEFRVPVASSRSKIKGSENRFTLGGGGADVTVRTFRGRVVVRSR
jgi:hypothetical protein